MRLSLISGGIRAELIEKGPDDRLRRSTALNFLSTLAEGTFILDERSRCFIICFDSTHATLYVLSILTLTVDNIRIVRIWEF